MSTNANDPQSPAAYIAGLLRVGATTAAPESAARMRAEADRLDPPARKTVTWEGSTYHLDAEGVTSSGVTYWTRGFIDAVVLPLLADAPDGPIPDETCERARDALWQACGADLTEQDVCAALEAVRGLPGMAVVRAGKPPEVLRWEVWDKDCERIARYFTRETARKFIRRHYEEDEVRVVAIIADPGEGTV